MTSALLIDPGKCTGCQDCELACSFAHVGEFRPARSRIKVFEFEHGRRSIPYTCSQCAEEWCRKSCPTGAILRNVATGAVEVTDSKCVGCKACTIACPYGTIAYNPDSGKVDKCDLCGGGVPQCAAICPTDAIIAIAADPAVAARVRFEPTGHDGIASPI